VVQLDILTGNKAGTQWIARRFPFCIGRSAEAALPLQEPGVWDRHAEFSLRAGEGVLLRASKDASLLVNSHPVQEALLRNGDLIEAGSVKLRFSLSPTRQRGLRLREVLTWLALAALCLGQVALIYWLID
jgi:pSer/pThr/pTyr-binding forkhead associated (FHA) protein